MQIALPPELERLIEEKMASGQYNCPSEVVQEALWLLRDRETLRQIRFEELKREIALGIEASERGEVIPAEEVFRRLRECHAELAEQQ